MSTHTLHERGDGFPSVGQRVYSAIDNAIYTVESIDSGILTRQFQSSRVLATLSYACQPGDLSKAEFDSLIDLHVSSSPFRFEVRWADGSTPRFFASLDAIPSTLDLPGFDSAAAASHADTDPAEIDIEIRDEDDQVLCWIRSVR
ncbi:MAG: hypothetical protein BGP25_05315 [Lysobacterales bacterium 63-13]|nr:MAG: hypothetical protein BGP25_05315 [Xanthomonadales bacterium 63-13]